MRAVTRTSLHGLIELNSAPVNDTALMGKPIIRVVVFQDRSFLTKQGGLWLGMTGGLSTQVRMILVHSKVV